MLKITCSCRAVVVCSHAKQIRSLQHRVEVCKYRWAWSENLDKLVVIRLFPVHQVAWVSTELMFFLTLIH